MKKTVIFILFIMIFLFTTNFAMAGGAIESQISEIQMLMIPLPDDPNMYALNNLQAAEMISAIIEQDLNSLGVSNEQRVRLLFLQADAYHNAKEFDSETQVLRSIIQSHSEYFEEVERRLQIVRSIQDQYNNLLGQFLDEIKKSPNDPADPFVEEEAFQYINQMSNLLSNQNETILTEIDSYREQIKLAVDRGYRDRIITSAHDLILEGNYLEAMNRYLIIQDIDETGYYQTSFDLRKEELQELNLPSEFITRMDSLSQRIQELYPEFANLHAALTLSLPQSLIQIDGFFTDDPLEIVADAENFANIAIINQVLNDFGSFANILNEIKEISGQILQLETEARQYELGNFDERNIEHLVYLQQFVSGIGQFEDEGIEGAADRQATLWINEVKNRLNAQAEIYIEGVQNAYRTADRSQISAYQTAYQRISDFFLIYLSYLALGQEIDQTNRTEFISQMRIEDQSDAAQIFLERLNIEDQISLLEYSRRYEDLISIEYTFSSDLLSAFQTGLTILNELSEHSSSYREELGRISESIQSQESGSISEPYVLIHEMNRSAIANNVIESTVPYFQRYQRIILDPILDILPNLQEDLASSQRELAGIEVEFQVEQLDSIDIRYFPRQALNRLIPTRDSADNFLSQVETLQGIIDGSIDEMRLVSGIITISEDIDNIKQELESLIESVSIEIDRAQGRVERADTLIANARNVRSNFISASLESDYDRANEFFSIIENSYNESLNIDFNENIYNERNEVLLELSGDLNEILFTVINVQKLEALERVANALNNNEYFQARDALEDAKILDDQLPRERDPVIIAYESEIERLILLSGVRDLPPISDSRYSRISNDLNEAGKSLLSAQRAFEADNLELLSQEVTKSRRFLSSVQDQIPANFEAALINLQLVQLENPQGFNEYFIEEVTEIETLVYGSSAEFASGEYSEYTDIEKDQLLSRVEALNEIGSDSRLNRLIIDIEVDLGRRESPEIVQARSNATILVNQARSLLTQARSESNPSLYESLLSQALERLQQAQVIFPLIPDISSLISEAEVLLGLEITVSLPFEVNQIFEQAISLFVSQDLIGAKNILDILWNNDGYRSYFPLRDLITQLYNILGQELPI